MEEGAVAGSEESKTAGHTAPKDRRGWSQEEDKGI